MREPRALRKSRGVVELSARQLALDFLHGVSGGAPIVAIVVEAEILAAAFAAISESNRAAVRDCFQATPFAPLLITAASNVGQ